MNTERIKELAEQAGDDWDHTLEEDKEFLKKFAELIVKECLGDFKDRIDRRYQGSVRDRDVAYGMEIVYSNIRDKFGVNE
jgi:hypothetical protein